MSLAKPVSGSAIAFEPGDELCPPWWPEIIFKLHNWHPPKGWPGGPGGPVNYPPALQDIMASLAIHTFSYLQIDQNAAQQIRTDAEANLVNTIKQLSSLHQRQLG